MMKNTGKDFPTPPLIIGSGRLATHLKVYLRSKGVSSWLSWSRDESFEDLTSKAANAGVAFLAVSDHAIEDVAKKLPKDLTKIHFSGSTSTSLAVGIHPLMTFAHTPLEPGEYDRIPLVMDPDALELSWLDQLPNPKFVLKSKDKPLYHSFCHLAGNYPKLIWENICSELEQNLNLPREIFYPYLHQVLKQVIDSKTDLNAGPFGRKDLNTISAHLESLNAFPSLKTSYSHFLESFNTRENHDDLT